VGPLRTISGRNTWTAATADYTQDKPEDGADGPKKEDTGHRGFNGAIVHVRRKLRYEKVTSDGDNQVACDTKQQSESEAS
jgi:hypothetical protein